MEVRGNPAAVKTKRRLSVVSPYSEKTACMKRLTGGISDDVL